MCRRVKRRRLEAEQAERPSPTTLQLGCTSDHQTEAGLGSRRAAPFHAYPQRMIISGRRHLRSTPPLRPSGVHPRTEPEIRGADAGVGREFVAWPFEHKLARLEDVAVVGNRQRRTRILLDQ